MNSRIIYNPSAGTKTVREDLNRAAAVLMARGWSVEILETARTGDATRLARAAATEKFNAVIAVGGDGTVNEVANGLVDSETALGVLPLGTANVWAKEMGLPLGDLRTAARRLADADIRLIDVGQVRNENIAPRVFVLWSGIGLDALVTRDVEPQRAMKRRFGAFFFGWVGVRDAWSYRGKHATMLFDGKRTRKRVIMALACNAQLYAGIARIAPDAKIDDGLLDVVVLKGTGVWATAWHLVRVIFGAHVRDPQTEIHRVAAFTITGRNLPLHVDAEPIGYAPIEICVRPRALRVLVPKTANQNLFQDPASF